MSTAGAARAQGAGDLEPPASIRASYLPALPPALIRPGARTFRPPPPACREKNASEAINLRD